MPQHSCTMTCSCAARITHSLSQHLLTSPAGLAALARGTLSGQSPTVSTGFLAPSLQESMVTSQPLVVSSPQQGTQVSLTSSLVSNSSSSATPEQGGKGEEPTLHPFNNPSLPPIPTRLLRVIQAGGYINLGELLPEALAEAFDKPHKEGKNDPPRKQFSIEAPLDWAMAFATFAAATAHYHPERAPSLLIYFGIIMRLAREGGAKTWLRYDRAFRQAAAINPSLPWDRREPDLWLAALSQEPQCPTNPPRSFGLSDVTGGNKRAPHLTICHRFNKRECNRASCRFTHKCLACQSPSHPALDCPILQVRKDKPHSQGREDRQAAL